MTTRARLVRDNSAAVRAVLNRAHSLSVFVGFLEGAHGKGPITNAQLAYIHEHGAPGANIPARPFLRPPIEDNDAKLVEILTKGLKRALNTLVVSDVDVAYERTGLAAVGMVQNYMSTGRFTPLKPATVRRKGSSQPLIDTGQLRQSVTHVVRPK
jgi:hypothetical protein